jgi:DNA replication protein DnaC
MRVMNGRDSLRGIPMSPYDANLGAEIACPRCGEPIQIRECALAQPQRAEPVVPANDPHAIKPLDRRSVRYWSECSCLRDASAAAAARSAVSLAHQAALRAEADPTDLRLLQSFTFESFDPNQLEDGRKLLDAAQGWLEQIRPHTVAPSYHEPVRPCLYFYSKGKGRGKTHLAVALLNAARASGRRATFADEIGYIERYWAAPLEARAWLSALPGERAWLTVLDDLGQRESTGPGLRDAWYDVINMRWLKRGWTIITSNWRPEQLVERGTINEATYSRIVQMTRGKLITFSGSDQRLPHAHVQENDL